MRKAHRQNVPLHQHAAKARVAADQLKTIVRGLGATSPAIADGPLGFGAAILPWGARARRRRLNSTSKQQGRGGHASNVKGVETDEGKKQQTAGLQKGCGNLAWGKSATGPVG
jgi:hypothetical protein